MLKKINQDWINGLIMALVIIGLALALVGAVQFVDASIKLSNNPAQQRLESGNQTSPETNEDVQGLIAADLQRRDLSAQRNQGLMVGGGGLAVLAVGWIAYDFARSRRKKAAQNTSTASTSV